MKLEELQIEYNQKGRTRVLCGGAWGNFAQGLLSPARFHDFPDFHFNDYGFRIVRFDDET
jgi:lipoprotein signal peptidase